MYNRNFPELSSKEYKAFEKKCKSNVSHCGAIKFTKTVYQISDKIISVQINDDDTGQKRQTDTYKLEHLRYCEPCLKLSGKIRQCLRCDKDFTPGCNIKYFCESCYRMNRGIKDAGYESI